MTSGRGDITQRLRQLIQIGIALASERDIDTLLEQVVLQARHFTAAEAGTLFLREGDKLKFAVVQNDVLTRRLGEREMRRQLTTEPLEIARPSLAGWVATTGELVSLPDAYAIPAGRAYRFNPQMDEKLAYRTRSVLAVPLRQPSSDVIGVLQLINAVDEAGSVVAFSAEDEELVRPLASQAAIAIRKAHLEEMSFKDMLTDVYNRRYFELRVEEEAKRQARFGEPVSVALFDIDLFKEVNDRLGHAAGDEVLREVAHLLMANSRSYSIVTRYGGDEFAVLLVNTPKSGAIKYAQRLKDVVARHPFARGPVTVSVGVASMPDDVLGSGELIQAADRALYVAKRQGRNAVEVA